MQFQTAFNSSVKGNKTDGGVCPSFKDNHVFGSEQNFSVASIRSGRQKCIFNSRHPRTRVEDALALI